MSDVNGKKKGKSFRRRVALVGAVVLVAAWAAYKTLKPESVLAVQVAPSTIVQTVVATGRISPPATVEVGPRYSGVVTEVSVKEGDAVEAGSLLVHFDDREWLAQKSAAVEVVAQARLKLDNLRRVLSPKAVEELKQAEVAVRQAQDDLGRTEILRNAGAANDQDIERVRLSLDQARSRREAVALQAGSVSAGGVEYRMGLSGLGQAEAALQQIEERIVDTHLTARTAGSVLSVRADVGDTVQPGQVLVVLAATGGLEVKVPVDEKNIAGVEKGRSALISAEAYPDRHFPAVVERLAPSVDATRGTVEVTLSLPNPPPFLRPEMTASVEIEVARKEEALCVPSEALASSAKGHSVFVLADGRARRQSVKLGIRGTDAVEVKEGLSAGDVVLLPGAAGLEEGVRVAADIAAEAAPLANQ
ncbi:MAG: efflux RND transporter periplasmic adaptor subunit [Myxococcota bacterium]|jgi:HlyD family secretion protein|nr:efflux RND transporter periplasmic adaptor subunit [Myxococcota bacterium]